MIRKPNRWVYCRRRRATLSAAQRPRPAARRCGRRRPAAYWASSRSQAAL